jgi:hypothetical protein
MVLTTRVPQLEVLPPAKGGQRFGIAPAKAASSSGIAPAKAAGGLALTHSPVTVAGGLALAPAQADWEASGPRVGAEYTTLSVRKSNVGRARSSKSA